MQPAFFAYISIYSWVKQRLYTESRKESGNYDCVSHVAPEVAASGYDEPREPNAIQLRNIPYRYQGP